MRYRLKPKDSDISEIYSCVLRDKEVVAVSGNKLKQEVNKEIETWITYGKIKDYYLKRYPQPLVDLINKIIKKWHKKYKGMWEQAQKLEKYYEETDLEEMEEAYEVTMTQVQEEKNKMYYDFILPELNKMLKEEGFI